MGTDVTEIRVPGTPGYPVLVGRGLLTAIAEQLGPKVQKVLIVHAPRVFRSSHIPSEWTSMFIALGMCGGALLIASALANISSAASPVAESRRFAPGATITS